FAHRWMRFRNSRSRGRITARNTDGRRAASSARRSKTARIKFRSPGPVSLALLVGRIFFFTKRTRLVFCVELYNVTNSANFGRANAVIGSPQAGTITHTATPNRQIQLGLRLVF